MTELAAIQEYRKWKRFDVEMDATLQSGECTVTGKIHDFGGGGVFFEPEYGYIDGSFVTNAECLDKLDIDENTIIYIKHSELYSNIRWSGYHGKHGCGGFGIQFKNPVYPPK